MATHSRTLLLLGLTLVPLAALSGCIIDTTDNGGASCFDSRYFEVQWEVDSGTGTPMLLCSQTPSSRVLVTTNFGQQLAVLEDSCTDGLLYNHDGFTQAGLAAGTTVVRADLVSNVDGRILSSVDVRGLGGEVPVGSCTPVVHRFEFPLAP